MIKKIILFIFITLSFSFAQSEEKKITFIINSPKLSDSSKIFITGNHEKFGSWNPSKVVLNKNGESIWKKTFSFPAGEKLEFKFTKGSWHKEAVDENGKAPDNYFFTVMNDTIINFTIEHWKDEYEEKLEGQVTGTVKYHYNLKGMGINSRDIIVWFPPGYEEDTTKTFPVLYAHDGQNIFDPSTSAFGVDWQIDEKADSLIKAGIIEPVIIVGIYNTPARMAEYTNTDSGTAYMNFIVNELKPFIDDNYRTKTNRENTATIGSSAGGTISFMLAWEHPEVFSKAACLSPAFHIGSLNYLPAVDSVSNKKPVKIYIDNGELGVDEKLQPGIDKMLYLLKEKGYVINKDLFWFKDEKAEHNEKAWANRVAQPLKFLFGK